MATHSEHIVGAVEWYMKLSSGDATESDREAWSAWINQSDANAHAWHEITSALGKFQSIPTELGMSVLGRKQEKVDLTRRSALRNLAVFAAIALPTALLAQKNIQHYYHDLTGDYVTGVGESREVLLADGTVLALNTDSAVTVKFNATESAIKLHHGEILISSAHGISPKQPLHVETQHGKITPIGTKFNVRKFDEFTRVSLLEGQLKLKPTLNDTAYLMNANQEIDMNTLAVVHHADLQSNAASWLNGYVEVNDLPLSAFVDELSRYQHGYMVCHPDLNHVRISGSYSIKNIEASLESLTQTFPINIQRATPYLTILLPQA